MFVYFILLFFFYSKSLVCCKPTEDSNDLFPEPFIHPQNPLIITDLLKENNSTEEIRKLSLVDPSLFLDVESYSGFVTVDEKYDSNIFYWYFPSSHTDNPLMVHLEGGPGVSVLFTVLLGNSPFVYKNKRLNLNKHSWINHFSLLYIDGPVGTGYGWTNASQGYGRHMNDYKHHYFETLKQVFQAYPELNDKNIYIGGSSYVGKFASLLAEAIHEHQGMKLKGIAIGNPMIGPEDSYGAISLSFDAGLLDSETMKQLVKVEQEMKFLVEEKRSFEAFKAWSRIMAALGYVTSTNAYNYLTSDEGSKNFEIMYFLSDPKIKKALHVGERMFVGSSSDVKYFSRFDFANTAHNVIENLLDNGYKVLVFSGHLDRVIPYRATRERLTKLRWREAEKFASDHRIPFQHDGKIAGYLKSGGGLTELMFLGGGHGILFEKPDIVLKQVLDFVQDNKVGMVNEYCIFNCLLNVQLVENDLEMTCKGKPADGLIKCACRNYCQF